MLSRFLTVLLPLTLWTVGLLGADGDKLFFSRDFPGSVPEYFDVTVDTNGKVIYRESLDDELPIEFQAPEPEVSRMFEISEQLGYFEKSFLPPKEKTAFTGNKILRYTKANGSSDEVEFVFQDDAAVLELVCWFLRVGNTEWHRINIERAVQFDRLGVNKAILQFNSAFDRGRIVAPRQFLPLLENISKDMKIMHLARSRAAGLAEQIEAGAVSGE
ncbi:MAG: hypothetical protein O3A53_00045 [Acidobacteria bacterium]|nr:hypothetical protein [Acidobacteriota bacterium]